MENVTSVTQEDAQEADTVSNAAWCCRETDMSHNELFNQQAFEGRLVHFGLRLAVAALAAAFLASVL